ncbi:MAG: hypothetical protein ACP5D2_03245 [Candidatus Nanoarchaeia archaeon]
MKKNLFICLFLVLMLSSFSTNSYFVKAQDDMPSAPMSEDYDKIKDATDSIPLDEQGGIDEDKIDVQKSKAEERINAINDWLERTDKYFLWLFNIPLRLSWEFTYLFFLVLLSISVFHNLPNWIGLDKEWVNIVLAVGVTFALGFFRIFAQLVEWIILITNKWWWNLIVIGVIIVLIAIAGFGSRIGKKIKEKQAKQQEELDRERLHSAAEVGDAFTNAFSK